MAEPVLRVEDLQVRFGRARAVNGLDYEVGAGETVAIVGESGSGKSVAALALLGLLPPHAEVEGRVWFEGADLVAADTQARRRVRGNRIAMVFQDPITSLNPVLTVGRQLVEAPELHLGLSPEAARDRAAELLGRVGLPNPRSALDAYPHQLSGGMRQRVMIAMALSCDPAVLIADEATTALDVTTQAQVTELVGELQAEFGTAVVWITHDLGVVAGIADRVLVMYAGRVLEAAGVDDLYARPSHPYTAGLLAAIPVVVAGRAPGPPADLAVIPGLPPDPADLPPGCPFWPRCTLRFDERCRDEVPPLREVAPGHLARTFYDPEGQR